MKSLNKVQLIGHLGKDPEVRYTPGGTAVAEFSLATSEKWRDKQTGEQKEATEWHTITCWDKLAEIVGEYLKKGAPVYVEGKIKTQKWQDRESGQDRYRVKIQAEQLIMLGSSGQEGATRGPSSDREQPRQPAQPARQQPARPAPDDPFDDDIPF